MLFRSTYIVMKSDSVKATNDTYPATGYIKFAPDYFTKVASEMNGHYNFHYSNKAVLLIKQPPTASVKGRLVSRDPGNPLSDIKPVRNTEIGLMVTYYVSDNKGAKTILDPYHALTEIKKDKNSAVGGSNTGDSDSLYKALKNPFGDGNVIFARCSTNSSGEFEFKDFPHSDTLGTFKEYQSFGPGGPCEFRSSLSINGAITRTFRLVVMDHMNKTDYFNPSDDIVVQPQDSIDVGVLTAYGRNYNLTVIPRKAP